MSWSSSATRTTSAPSPAWWMVSQSENWHRVALSQPGMDGLIDVEQKGYELISFWTHYITLTFDSTHDFDFGFWNNCFRNGWVHFLWIQEYIKAVNSSVEKWKYICPFYTKYTRLLSAIAVLRIFFSCDQAALRTLISVCLSVRLSHLFSCDQAALRTLISVCPSVRLSVCHTFLTIVLSLYHPEIFRTYYRWQMWRPCRGEGQGSKVKVTEVMTPLSRFRTVTPVRIHI